MSRLFHLSCMGPLDSAARSRPELAESIGALLGEAGLGRAALAATCDAPLLITPAEPTLPKTRALDAALLRLGVFSLTRYFDTDSESPSASRLFLDQRGAASRRAEGAQDAQEALVGKRRSLGRRVQDLA